MNEIFANVFEQMQNSYKSVALNIKMQIKGIEKEVEKKFDELDNSIYNDKFYAIHNIAKYEIMLRKLVNIFKLCELYTQGINFGEKYKDIDKKIEALKRRLESDIIENDEEMSEEDKSDVEKVGISDVNKSDIEIKKDIDTEENRVEIEKDVDIEDFIENMTKKVEIKKDTTMEDIIDNIIEKVENTEKIEIDKKEIEGKDNIKDNEDINSEAKKDSIEDELKENKIEVKKLTELVEYKRDDLSKYTIVAFKIRNKKIQTNSWRDFLVKVCMELENQNSLTMRKLMANVELTKCKRPFFILETAKNVDYDKYNKIGNGYLVYNRCESIRVCKHILKFLRFFKIQNILCYIKVKPESDTNIDTEGGKPISEILGIEKVEKFSFENKFYEINSGRQLLSTFCELLINKDEQKFVNEVLDKYEGTRYKYFLKDKPTDSNNYIRIGNTKYYIYLQPSMLQIRKIIVRLLKDYNIPESNLLIYLKGEIV